jgi:predicted O-methyltransferase YrrM
MNELLQEILKTDSVKDENGNVIPLHSSVNIDETDFISKLIKEHRLSRAIEIGCAMGISSLAIAESIDGVKDSFHYILDPNQESQWKNMGINNLRKAGFQNFNLIEDYSEFALPRLVKEGVKVNFGFIDGWHTFDHTLLDFFYINRMLEVGGVIVIDDIHMSAVNRAVRYISNYPAYQYIGKVKNQELTSKRIFFEKAGGLFSNLKYLVGKKISNELFSAKLLKSDKKLNLDCTMIAFKKVAEDAREWNWYESF